MSLFSHSPIPCDVKGGVSIIFASGRLIASLGRSPCLLQLAVALETWVGVGSVVFWREGRFPIALELTPKWFRTWLEQEEVWRGATVPVLLTHFL